MQLDADGGAPAEFLIDLPFTGADRGTALSAALVEAKSGAAAIQGRRLEEESDQGR